MSELFGVRWKFTYAEYAAVGRVANHLRDEYGLDAGDALHDAEWIVNAVLTETKVADER
jgi:hypothetical protein